MGGCVPVEERQENFRTEEEVGKGEEGGREGEVAAWKDEHQPFLKDHPKSEPVFFYSLPDHLLPWHYRIPKAN